MCGVFGVAQIAPEIRSRDLSESLKLANRFQRHRGPDAQDYFFDAKLGVGLAHQRLSILDLTSNGAQPMPSQSGASQIVFNGEIYNHHQLRSEFQLRIRGRSDTAVLVEGLERNGAEFLSRLDGMFAFAFLNKPERKLLLAVDPTGKKPLYTYWDGKVFAFASELETLKFAPGVRLETDLAATREYLVHGYVPYPRTLYKNVQKLPAGHFQWIDLSRGPQAPIKYWDLLDHCKIAKISYKDAQAELRERLTVEVEKRLVADVPVGCFLSGGLDSSAISLLAAGLIPNEKIKTYSVSFSGSNVPAHYDESAYARKVAKLISSDHTEIHVPFDSLSSETILAHFLDPFADSSAIPTYLLCQKTSERLKVVLSGDGGDEIFAGYMRFRAGLIASSFGWLLKPLLSTINFKNPEHRSWQGFLTRFKERIALDPVSQQLAWNSYFSSDDFAKFLGESAETIYLRARSFAEDTKELELGQRILYYNFKTYLFDDLLVKTDRMSMAHGLEVRCPFLGKDLVEFAFSLPTHYKMNFFKTKKILKDTFAADFGREFVNRKKQGFALPIEKFLSRQDLKNRLALLEKHVPQLNWNPNIFSDLMAAKQFHKVYLLLGLAASVERASRITAGPARAVGARSTETHLSL